MANIGISGVSSPSLTNVTFSGNQATDGSGGGMQLRLGGVSSPSLSNVILAATKPQTAAACSTTLKKAA